MKLDRLAYAPDVVLDFYEQGLTALGALCERTWHDRLEVVAENRAARLWNDDGALHSAELHFAPPEVTTAHDPGRTVFPGCPLTFRLVEALRSSPLPLERVVLAEAFAPRAPEPVVAEKLWRSQFPETSRWRLESPFKAGFHFSLLALARCEIQAIDQHWSLHRVGMALPHGHPDDILARDIVFAQVEANPADKAEWPDPDPGRWNSFIQRALELDLAEELAVVRARQETSLIRELERIDQYFESYARELASRAGRSGSKNVKVKTAERLAAAQAEHARRRTDQVARHEIRVCPHLDALLLIAEPAWHAEVGWDAGHTSQTCPAVFVPRARQWHHAGGG